MGYLGMHLEDYYPHQLIEEANRQLKEDIQHEVDFKELKRQVKKLNKLVEKIEKKNEF